MKSELRQIPTIVEKRIYIAEDGAEFENQSQCESYERRLHMSDAEVEETAITDIADFWNELPATIYNIQTEEQWNYLVEKVWRNRQDIRDWPGPDVYYVVTWDGGDRADTYHIYNAQDYAETISYQAEDFYRTIMNAISEFGI